MLRMVPLPASGEDREGPPHEMGRGTSRRLVEGSSHPYQTPRGFQRTTRHSQPPTSTTVSATDAGPV